MPMALQHQHWPFGKDGDLVVSGTPVTVDVLSGKDYRTITVDTVLNLDSSTQDTIIVGCKGKFINNGQINVKTGTITGTAQIAPDGTVLTVTPNPQLGGIGGKGGDTNNSQVNGHGAPTPSPSDGYGTYGGGGSCVLVHWEGSHVHSYADNGVTVNGGHLVNGSEYADGGTGAGTSGHSAPGSHAKCLYLRVKGLFNSALGLITAVGIDGTAGLDGSSGSYAYHAFPNDYSFACGGGGGAGGGAGGNGGNIKVKHNGINAYSAGLIVGPKGVGGLGGSPGSYIEHEGSNTGAVAGTAGTAGAAGSDGIAGTVTATRFDG